MKGPFPDGRQHFSQEFRGAGGLDSRSRETLDGFFLIRLPPSHRDSPFVIRLTLV